MFVRVEPKDWMMYSIFLHFKQGTPDREDAEVKKYLTEHRLEPKRESTLELEGEQFDVMYFGGCYLNAFHMNAIADIQRSEVEREALVYEIPMLLKIGPSDLARTLLSTMSDSELQSAVEALAQQYHNEDSFETDAEGQIQIVLDPAALQDSFLQIVADSSG